MTLPRRAQRNDNSTRCTSKRLSQLLPRLLNQLSKQFEGRPDLILAAWPEVVGSRLSAMTKAVSFHEGVLLVRVNNSTLYTILNQYDKPRILQNLREKFPNTMIKTVLFRLG